MLGHRHKSLCKMLQHLYCQCGAIGLVGYLLLNPTFQVFLALVVIHLLGTFLLGQKSHSKIAVKLHCEEWATSPTVLHLAFASIVLLFSAPKMSSLSTALSFLYAVFFCHPGFAFAILFWLSYLEQQSFFKCCCLWQFTSGNFSPSGNATLDNAQSSRITCILVLSIFPPPIPIIQIPTLSTDHFAVEKNISHGPL